MKACLGILLLATGLAIKSARSLSEKDAIAKLDDQTVQVELRAKTRRNEAGHSIALLLNTVLDVNELYRIVNAVTRNRNVKVDVEAEEDGEVAIDQKLDGNYDQRIGTNGSYDGHPDDAGADEGDQSWELEEGLAEEWEGKKDKIVLLIHDNFEEKYDECMRNNKKLEDILRKQEVFSLVRSLQRNPQALSMFARKSYGVVMDALVDLLAQLKSRAKLTFGEKCSTRFEGLNLLHEIIRILEETVGLAESRLGTNRMTGEDAMLDQLQRNTKADKDTGELVFLYKKVKRLCRELLLDNLLATSSGEKSIEKNQLNRKWTSLLKNVLVADLKDYDDGTVMKLLTELTREKYGHASQQGTGEEQNITIEENYHIPKQEIGELKKNFNGMPNMRKTIRFIETGELPYATEQSAEGELMMNSKNTSNIRDADDHVPKQSNVTKERETKFNEKPDTEDAYRLQGIREELKSNFNGTTKIRDSNHVVRVEKNDHVLTQSMEDPKGNFTDVTRTRDAIKVNKSETAKDMEKHGTVDRKKEEDYSEYRRNAGMLKMWEEGNGTNAKKQSRMTGSNLFLTKEMEVGSLYLGRENLLKVRLMKEDKRMHSNAMKLGKKARKFMDAQGDSSSKYKTYSYAMDDLIRAVNKVIPQTRKEFQGRKLLSGERNVTSSNEN